MSRRDYGPPDGYDDRRSNVSRRPRTERNYEEADIDTRSRYDGPAPSRYDQPPPQRRGETVFKERETDTVVTQGQRTERRGPRQPDFLREDYGRNSNAGQLVVRDTREEEEDYPARAPSRRRSMETVRSSRPPPPRSERVERDEFVFRETERDRGGLPYPRSERGSLGEEERVVFRERERSRPPPERTEEKIDIRIREDDRQERRPPPREYRERDDVEDIRFRRGDGGRPPPARNEVDKEEITFTHTERSGPPPGRNEVDREEISFQETRSPPPRENYRGREVRKEEIDIDIRERSAQPPRQRSQSRGALVRKDREEWIVRRPRTPSPSPPRDFEKEEIIIRRKERSPSPVPEPPREPTPEPLPPPPEPIYRPPIIQEVITHHRHIDHGVERVRSPTPPPPPPSPPRDKEEDLEISIRRQGTRNGKAYDEEITFEKDTVERNDRSRGAGGETSRELTRARSVSTSARRRSPSRDRRRYDDDVVSAEADYYNQRAASRGYPGEAYNGATRDWGLVDIPPGTEKVRMDGQGGGAQEITWDRYRGERHGRFVTDDRVYDQGWGNGIPAPRQHLPPPREDVRETRITRTTEESNTPTRAKKDRMWTEISKDLVTKEAIEETGYEYEETDDFFYVMEYLRYVSHSTTSIRDQIGY